MYDISSSIQAALLVGMISADEARSRFWMLPDPAVIDCGDFRLRVVRTVL